MEENPSLNADSSSTSQKIAVLWNPNSVTLFKQFAICHYRKPDSSSPSSGIFISNLFSNYLPHRPVFFASGLFPSALPTKTLYAPLLSTTRANCTLPRSNHLHKVVCEQNKSLLFSLWNYLQSSLAPSISNRYKTTSHCTEQNDSPRK